MTWHKLSAWVHAPLFWMIGITTLLATFFAAVLAPLATRRPRPAAPTDGPVRDELGRQQARNTARVAGELLTVHRAAEAAAAPTNDIERARLAARYSGAPL